MVMKLLPSSPLPSPLGEKAITMETQQEASSDSDDCEDCPSSLEEEDIVHYDRHHKQQRSFLWRLVSACQTLVSAALLVFCVGLLLTALWTRQTRATSEAYRWPPAVACALFWIVLAWLAVIEGGLNCQVGLRPLPTHLYATSHPLAYQATQVCAARPNNLQRFIVGRQYMDLSMVFTISFLCTAVQNVQVWNLPRVVCFVFLNTGLAMAFVTIVLGQLALQINAANCMLDYMNNYAMLGSTYLALAVEATGICHVVYLVQRIATAKRKKASSASTSNTSSSTQKTPLWQSLLFWLRVMVSASLLVFALVTVVVATFRKQTKMFAGVPPWASLLFLVALIVVVGLLDALQIALMAVVHIPSTQLQHRPTALHNAQYVGSGRRLQSLLLGRQIGQTAVQFLLARITTLDVPIGQDENIWGVSDSVQKLFNMGILGAIIATVLASLMWRVLASAYPLAFLSLPVSKPLIAVCLWAEGTGVINISWALAALHRRVAGMRTDEYYLGNTEYYREHHKHHAHDHHPPDLLAMCSSNDNINKVADKNYNDDENDVENSADSTQSTTIEEDDNQDVASSSSQIQKNVNPADYDDDDEVRSC